MPETAKLIPYTGPAPLTPDAVLDGPIFLRGEYDPEAARRRAREQLMALENLPYQFAVTLGPTVVALNTAMAQIAEAFGEAARAFAASVTPPVGADHAAMMRQTEAVRATLAPCHPTRYERHMARVAATPRRKRRDRRRG